MNSLGDGSQTAAGNDAIDERAEQDRQDALEKRLEEVKDHITARMAAKYKEIVEYHLETRRTLPINAIQKKYEFVNSTYDKNDTIAGLIAEVTRTFNNGLVFQGAGALAWDLISKVISSESEGEEQSTYAITIDSLGGISRLDAWFYSRTVTTSPSSMKRVTIIGCLVVRSFIDVEKLDRNQIRVTLADCFGSVMPQNMLEIVYAQIASEIPTSNEALKVAPPTNEQKTLLQAWYYEQQNAKDRTEPEPVNHSTSAPEPPPAPAPHRYRF